MTRPHIIRADTIDLQNPDAPSAKDHSRAPNGSFGPHQAETLREVAQESAEDQARSPRLSWTHAGDDDDISDSDDLAGDVSRKLTGGTMDDASKKQQQQDALAVAQNGGVSDDGNMDDTDESMDDDDMMDKISSSPSIEDEIAAPPFPLRLSRQGPLLLIPNPLNTLQHTSLGSIARLLPAHTPVIIFAQTDEYCDNEQHCDECYDERDWQDENDENHTAEFGIQSVAQHGPIVVSPLRLRKFGEPIYDDFAQRRAEMERAERDEAVGGLDDDGIPLTIPYEPSNEEDDDDGDVSLIDDSRYIACGWGNECLHEAEDIDFEFVYALHTFVATVEGQANATKGDTMVLLDDSNSYWWLVRVVKDSSIGYLPAEHIETPTERLARLNKHRNIDVVAPSMEEMNLSDLDQLSATMLGDQSGEKSKSTFKTALRKKKKTVAFAAPTFVDYSDYDYSSDEDEVDELLSQQEGAQQQQQQQQQQQTSQQTSQQSTEETMDDDTAKVEPLKPRTTKEVNAAEPTKKEEASEDDSKRDSGEIFEKPEGPSRSRNGTVRNTDSFFKDETVETKKITLTPNLLRDDSGSRPSTTESVQVKQRPSLDKMDKELQPDKKEDKKKKDKKEKEKKTSTIRSFFSRKDKKKTTDDDDESFGKRSMDTVTESQDRESRESRESREEELQEPLSPRGDGPQRNPSKLQKQQPRVEPSPARNNGAATPQKSATRELSEFISSEGRPNNVSNMPPASMRIVEDDSSDPELSGQQQRIKSPETTRSPPQERSTLSKIMPSRSGNSEPKPQKVTKAKSRVELDDFDSSGEEVEPAEPPVQQQAHQIVREEKLERPLPGAFPDSFMSSISGASAQTDKTITPTQSQQPQSQPTAVERQKERLSESPVQVSPVTSRNPPALMVDTSSQEGHSTSPSPELIDAEEAGRHRAQDSMTASSTSTGGSTTGSSWNDAKLRAFFDSSSDIRDMLVVVYDKSDVAPAGPEHPVAGSLFREQNAKLAEITTQLDNMLGDWLARKQRLRGTV
ncbi:SH3 domain-containing protein [Colletotrichum orchidophilum]|uniref:SH3 domain-containing protein n=1 Tax=Colletotrichum orchidophilum TaxID=1209926 RepID=A0A1G4AZ41_9PEZI|nr:SH3 domain-containing protein [Colletotrichum orchidophilum]OHE94448.1 SH3 domain-containing protein [Colletotrichum orchidophilum]